MKIIAIIFSILLFFSHVSNALSISSGETAPPFTLSSSEGKTLSLSNYKGKVTVIIFWRTDQKRSLLALQDAQNILGNLKGKDVSVISVIGEKETMDEAKKILADNTMDFPLLIDSDRQLYGEYGIRVFPTTMVIDKEGLLVDSIPSHPASYRLKLNGYIKKALGEIDEAGLESMLHPQKEVTDGDMLEATRLYNLSLKFVEMRMYDQAIESAANSIKAKPDMAKSHILIGYLYMEVDEADKALAAFDKALELSPESHDAQTGRGSALLMKGDVDSAIKILDKAALANPYPQKTYYELGKAYEIRGDKDKAVEMYKKAFSKIVKKHILPSSLSRCQ
ncbi:MAG: redoxin domain-containing protein [Nitrospiraceae bacterium]|nr:MAG: redoxin domain-containing protein [Nitrospiraceae bacterium]